MSKVFPGTEFADDGSLIQPLSLALVSETGAGYYAIVADGGMNAVVEDEWLRAHVVPHLPVTVAASGTGWAWDTGHVGYPQVRPRARIAAEVRAFPGGQPKPEIWACCSPYDAMILCQLYGPVNALHAEIPMFGRDLMQEADRTGTASRGTTRRRTTPCTTHDTTASSPRPSASSSKERRDRDHRNRR